MKPQSVDLSNGSHDPAWQLLIDLSLPFSEDLAAGTLFNPLVEMVHTLGLRHVQFERLQEDIVRRIRNYASARSGQIGPEFSMTIRLFVKPGNLQAAYKNKNQPGGDPRLDQRAHGSKPGESPQPEGGWGYFLSERTLPHTGTGLEAQSYLVELFLYREGK